MEWISVNDRMPEEGQIVDVWETEDTQTQYNIIGLEDTHHKSQYTGWRSTNYKYSFKQEKEGETYHSFEKVSDAYLNISYPRSKELIVENGEVTHWMPIPDKPIDKEVIELKCEDCEKVLTGGYEVKCGACWTIHTEAHKPF